MKNPRQDLPDLGRVKAAAMLGMLRDARAIVYRDAESFSEAAAILEHVGQMLQEAVLKGLNDYKNVIFELARKAPLIQRKRVEFLFDTVRKARNDSVHSGDYIRHHALRLVEFLLVLEEGLSMSGKIAGDLMVQNPTTSRIVAEHCRSTPSDACQLVLVFACARPRRRVEAAVRFLRCEILEACTHVNRPGRIDLGSSFKRLSKTEKSS